MKKYVIISMKQLKYLKMLMHLTLSYNGVVLLSIRMTKSIMELM